MTRRELAVTALVALTLLATVPAFDRVFADTSWREPAIAAGVIALTLAAVVRRLRWGGAVVTMLSAVGFVSFAPWLVGLAAGPVLPGPEAVGVLRRLFTIGIEQLQQTPSPAEPLAGLLLLVVGGWWLVAHLAHELSVRWRRPAAGLVVVTVLWAAPLAIPLPGPSWPQALPFLAAAALLLLATGGHEVGDPEPVRATGISVPGLAVGGMAIAVAITAPGVLPGYQQAAWVELGDGSSPRGYQPMVDVSQRLQTPEERDVLRVRSSQRTYLRLAGLESFDGSTWRLGPTGTSSYRPDAASLTPADERLPPERASVSTEPVSVAVEVLSLENIYVPTPYQPVEVLGAVRDEMVWSTDGGFLATWDTTEDVVGDARVGIREGVEYRVNAQRPAPTIDQLRQGEVESGEVERFTALPRGYPELGEQAQQVYDAAGATTAVDRALALQEWFIGPEGDFTYDLEVPALPDDDALTDFVLEDRVGYCEYFATAMAVMLRETGIPARVAVGFLPGRITDPDLPGESLEGGLTEYTVSTSDAHAWVEVLFPEAGWVTFEPTPRSDNSHVVPTADDLAPIQNEAERLEEAEETPDDDPDGAPPTAATPDEPPEEEQVEEEAGATRGIGIGATSVGTVFSGLLVMLVLAAAALVAADRRRRHPAGRSAERRVLDAQHDLFATAARYGIGRAPNETTLEVMERWHRERRVDERGGAVATTVQAAAFGGHVDDDVADEVEHTVAEFESLLRASVPRRDRLLAPLRRPASAVRLAYGRVRDTITGWAR